ncbi:MAG: hypothetical protein AB1Z81_10880 [Desulfotignum sp.]
MILVNTSVWINYFNGIPSWQTDLLDQQECLSIRPLNKQFPGAGGFRHGYAK